MHDPERNTGSCRRSLMRETAVVSEAGLATDFEKYAFAHLIATKANAAARVDVVPAAALFLRKLGSAGKNALHGCGAYMLSIAGALGRTPS